MQAPPGAGKSTALPLTLLAAAQWQGQRILMLQPRRIAALSIARFLATQLGETVGQTVGYHMRAEQAFSAKTRLLILTEGMFTQYLQRDPELTGVGLVIFDEFHERNLAADLGLAMLLEARQLRPDLALLVMSATLPAQAIASWLQQCGVQPCPVLQCEGRSFPVQCHYRPPRASESWQQALPAVVQEALQAAELGVLVFLPGQAEIQRLAEQLQAAAKLPPDVMLFTLYSQLPLQQQQQVLAAPQEGVRRLILATNIAETSLTLQGIDVVVDSGRERQAQFYPAHGVTRLLTRRISLASAQQRAGRAGRLQAGQCFRLWASADEHGMRTDSVAELETAELSDFLLECRRWGSSPEQLQFFTPPAAAHLAAAQQLLERLGIAHANGQLTAIGQALSGYGSNVRLARIAYWARSQPAEQRAGMACLLAQLEQPLRQGHFPQPLARLPQLIQQRYRAWCALLEVAVAATLPASLPLTDLLWGFADRVAQRRGDSDRYLLSYGGGARLHEQDPLPRSEYLLVLELTLQEQQAEALIRTAIELKSSDLNHPALSIQERQLVQLQGPQQRLSVVQERYLGALVLQRQVLSQQPSAALRSEAWLHYVARHGLDCLQWSAVAQQWLARVRLAQAQQADWPDFSPTTLLRELAQWALPYWHDIQSVQQLQQWSPLAALQARLSYPQAQQLEQDCPTHWLAPSGRRHLIDYLVQPPLVALKLQEVFGEPSSPRICQGRVTLTLDLLSPAGRLLQRTSDLASFWNNAYQQVKKEMRGRYPKHPWPDDPTTAVASHLVKRLLS